MTHPKNCFLFDPNETWKKTRLPGGSYTMREMLQPIFIHGECVYTSPSVMEIAAYLQTGKKRLSGMRQNVSYIHTKFYVDLSRKLYDTKAKLLNEVNK